MRTTFMALMLLALAAPVATAETVRARIEGPGPDGYYTARAIGLPPGETLEPWAYAEGAVDGRPRSVLLRLEPTSEPGTFRFPRTWPEGDRWMIRYCLWRAGSPTTVATLRTDGTVSSNRHYWKTDGGPECRRVLRKHWTKWKEDEGC